MKKYLQKRMYARNKQLRYDFLPPMLEIIERPANRAAGFIIGLITLSFVSVLVWAYFFKLDVVVTARGVMLPENNLIPMQSEYGGIVSELFVSETENVEKDAPILSLDQTGNEMKVEDLQYELRLLQVQKATYDEIYTQLKASEEEQSSDTDAEQEKDWAHRIDGYEEFSGVVDSLVLEQELYQSQQKQYDLQISASTDSNEKKQLKNQLESFVLQRKLTVIQNLNSLDVKLHEKEAELEEATYLSGTKVMKAPMAGTVTQLQVTTAGTYIPAGQVLAYLIPENATMIFRAYVNGAEVEHISEGDRVSVRLAALDDSDYEIVDGTIDRIGNVTVNVEGIGSAYEVEIRLENMPELAYRVGMEGTCDIMVGKRSVLDYFLEPFEKGLKQSLRES